MPSVGILDLDPAFNRQAARPQRRRVWDADIPTKTIEAERLVHFPIGERDAAVQAAVVVPARHVVGVAFRRPPHRWAWNWARHAGTVHPIGHGDQDLSRRKKITHADTWGRARAC